jgi:hypothetical protein
MLPDLRKSLEELRKQRAELEKCERRLNSLMVPGVDAGGKLVNSFLRAMSYMTKILSEFHRSDIQIKDLHRGLVDFPALRNGKEVFLCWEQDETDIEFWHDIDSGFSGRERL